MTVNGGDIIVTADVNRRVGTTTATSDSSATSSTTELSIDQVTASLISGRRYTITWDAPWLGTIANDNFFLILREGSGTGGTQLDFQTVKVQAATIPTETAFVQTDYTAAATGSQVFTGTARRSTGTGTLTAKGSSTQPRILRVDLAD
jgi:hypothetical protein